MMARLRLDQNGLTLRVQGAGPVDWGAVLAELAPCPCRGGRARVEAHRQTADAAERRGDLDAAFRHANLALRVRRHTASCDRLARVQAYLVRRAAREQKGD